MTDKLINLSKLFDLKTGMIEMARLLSVGMVLGLFFYFSVKQHMGDADTHLNSDEQYSLQKLVKEGFPFTAKHAEMIVENHHGVKELLLQGKEHREEMRAIRKEINEGKVSLLKHVTQTHK